MSDCQVGGYEGHTKSLQNELDVFLRQHSVPKEVDGRLKDCLIMSVAQLAAISDENSLHRDISTHVQWQGSESSHVGQRLWLVLAWKASRQLVALHRRLQAEAWAAAEESLKGGSPMPISAIRPEMLTARWFAATKLQAQCRMMLCRWDFVRKTLAVHLIQRAAHVYILRRRGFTGIRVESASRLRGCAAENALVLSFPWTAATSTESLDGCAVVVRSALELLVSEGMKAVRVHRCLVKSTPQEVPFGKITSLTSSVGEPDLTQFQPSTGAPSPPSRAIVRRTSLVGRFRRGEISDRRYVGGLLATQGVREVIQNALCPPLRAGMLGCAITASIGRNVVDYMFGRISGRTLLVASGRNLGTLGLDISMQGGAAAAGVAVGSLFGGPGILIGAVLGFLAGFFCDMASSYSEEFAERKTQLLEQQRQVRRAYRLLGLEPGCTVREVHIRYKRLLVEKVVITLLCEEHLALVKEALDRNLVVQKEIKINDGEKDCKAPSERLLLGVLVGTNQRPIKFKEDLTHSVYYTTGFPCKLVFTGEYVHPDKVPEEFKERQHAKLLALQLAVEMVKFTILNPDWDQPWAFPASNPGPSTQITDESGTQSSDGAAPEAYIQSLLVEIPRRTDTADISRLLSRFVDLPDSELPDELILLSRSHLQRRMSPGTLVQALRIFFASRGEGNMGEEG